MSLSANATPATAATTCLAQATAISFGSVPADKLVGAVTSGSLYEGCSGGWPTAGNMTVCNSIGAGTNSTSQTNRTMTLGTTGITYQLYSNSAYTTPYAYPGSDIFYISYSNRSGGYTTTTTYAKILSVPSVVPPGTYTDTYSSPSQAWADFDTWDTMYPPINCGQNGNYAGATPTFTVSVTVLASCSITATNLTFPATSVLNANVDAATNLSVTCTTATPYNVGIGASSGETTSARKMTGPGGTIAYGLYQDSGRTINWGNNPPPATSVDTVGGTGNDAAQSLPVYGRIPPQTTPTQGAYTDTVLVTVYY